MGERVRLMIPMEERHVSTARPAAFLAFGVRSYNSYMNSVKIADLKNNLSRHLARVRQGSELTVLDRDTPIARIVPFAPRPGRGGRTRAERRVSHGSGKPVSTSSSAWGSSAPAIRKAWRMGAGHEPVKLPKGTPSAVDLLIQMRRERTR